MERFALTSCCRTILPRSIAKSRDRELTTEMDDRGGPVSGCRTRKRASGQSVGVGARCGDDAYPETKRTTPYVITIGGAAGGETKLAELRKKTIRSGSPGAAPRGDQDEGRLVRKVYGGFSFASPSPAGVLERVAHTASRRNATAAADTHLVLRVRTGRRGRQARGSAGVGVNAYLGDERCRRGQFRTVDVDTPPSCSGIVVGSMEYI